MTKWSTEDDKILLRLVLSNRPFEKGKGKDQSIDKKWELVHELAAQDPRFTKKDIAKEALRIHYDRLMKDFDPAKRKENNELDDLRFDILTCVQSASHQPSSSSSSSKPSQATLNATEVTTLGHSSSIGKSYVQASTRGSDANDKRPTKRQRRESGEDNTDQLFQQFLKKAIEVQDCYLKRLKKPQRRVERTNKRLRDFDEEEFEEDEEGDSDINNEEEDEDDE